uniref:(California timema) hypothetical protein n=1 Tax=Timema californicum TaxID=61474 RepID=A0A7R9PF25_TIMCA|nr:unnamed protein product [Timema californicum]
MIPIRTQPDNQRKMNSEERNDLEKSAESFLQRIPSRKPVWPQTQTLIHHVIGAVDEFLELPTNYGTQDDFRVESAAHATEEELQANESSDVETSEPTTEPMPKKRKGVRKTEEEKKQKDQGLPHVNHHGKSFFKGKF